MGRDSWVKRARRQRETRLHKVAELDAMGKTVREIAETLSVGKSTVQRDLTKIAGQHALETSRLRSQQIGKQHYRYERLIAESWDAWKRSKTEAIIDPNTGTIRRVLDIGPGDPRFLARVGEFMRGLRELHGLDAPKRIQAEVTHYIDADELSDDDLAAIAAGSHQLDERGNPVLGGRTVAIAAPGPNGSSGIHASDEA